MLNHPIQLRILKQKYKIKKVFHQINKDLYLRENNLKTVERYQIIIFKKNQHYIWFYDYGDLFNNIIYLFNNIIYLFNNIYKFQH